MEIADAQVSPRLIARLEKLAVAMAELGGREIMAALGRSFAVHYKGDERAVALLRDPVSEVDRRVEAAIRTELANHFPCHGIIGEEMAVQPGSESDFVWAIDPIDGTNNFINGFPLFASSVGVIYRGVPIVGAVWCSTSHLLSPGVYHCGSGVGLKFAGEQLTRPLNPAVRKRLAGEPHARAGSGPWDGRKTGSAAVECAFVAAGLLQVARFEAPHIWDVAGGIALAQAVGSVVHHSDEDDWHAFESFGDTIEEMARWQKPMILGTPEDAARMLETRR